MLHCKQLTMLQLQNKTHMRNIQIPWDFSFRKRFDWNFVIISYFQINRESWLHTGFPPLGATGREKSKSKLSYARCNCETRNLLNMVSLRLRPLRKDKLKAFMSRNSRLYFLCSTPFRRSKIGICSPIKKTYLDGENKIEKNSNKQKQWMTLQKSRRKNEVTYGCYQTVLKKKKTNAYRSQVRVHLRNGSIWRKNWGMRVFVFSFPKAWLPWFWSEVAVTATSVTNMTIISHI